MYICTYLCIQVGTEVVDWMVKQRIAPNRRVAVAYGRELIRKAEIIHVARGHDFKDEPLFYRCIYTCIYIYIYIYVGHVVMIQGRAPFLPVSYSF